MVIGALNMLLTGEKEIMRKANMWLLHSKVFSNNEKTSRSLKAKPQYCTVTYWA